MTAAQTAPGQAAPPVATLAHGGSASEIEQALRILQHNDQMQLLVWMCTEDPELATTGIGSLIALHTHDGRRQSAKVLAWAGTLKVIACILRGMAAEREQAERRKRWERPRQRRAGVA